MSTKKTVIEDRKFLHDLATPLTLLRLHVRLLQKALSLGEGRAGVQPQESAKLLEGMLNALEKMEVLHGDHKQRVYAREKDLESNSAADESKAA